MKSMSNIIVLVAWSILIAACGGGGGSTPSPPMPPPLSSDASLSSLSLTGGTLDPAFSPAVTDYTATVPQSSSSVDVSATANDGNASFMINGSNNTTVALAVGDNTISIVVTAENGTTTRDYTIVVTRLTFAQEAYIKASNTDVMDQFSQSVALSGDGNTLAVGAVGEGSAAIGANGDQADNNASFAGAVYVFTRDTGGVWTQQAYVKSSNTDAFDRFGESVALSDDGNTLAVGVIHEDSAAIGVTGNQADNSAASAGAAYVFSRDSGGVWTQQAYVKASNTDAGDRFGQSVALSGDGNTLAMGADREDSAAIGVNGDQADNSAFGAGAAYVFTRDSGGVWTQQAYVKASNTDADDFFGGSAALSADGNTLAVGAGREDSAAIGVNGDQADNNARFAGAIYVFTRDTGGVWTQQAYVKASNTDAGDRFGQSEDFFGQSMALSGDGNTLAVGAFSEGSAATGVNGDQADNSASAAGAVYVFR